MPDVSGARGRNSRARRSSAGANTTQGPTVRRHLQARETPEIGSSMAGSELGQVFSTFFNGLTNAANVAGDAARIGINAEIDRRNAVERQQGQADALFGKDADPSLANDADYVDTFQQTKGARYGIELGQEMALAASELNYDADIDEFKQSFLKDKVGGGTGIPSFDGEMMRQFESATIPVVHKFKQRAVMETQRRAVEDTMSVFAASVASNQATASEFASTIEHATQLLGGDRDEARKRTFATMRAAMRTREGLGNALGLITTHGFGADGTQSFMEAFPEAGQQLMDDAMAARTAFATVDSMETFTAIDADMTMAIETGDIESLMAVGGRIQEFATTHNAMGHVATLWKNWTKAAAGVSGGMATMNILARLGQGGRMGPQDVSALKKDQVPFLSQAAGTEDWLNVDMDPNQVRALGQIVGNHGFASADLKHYVSTGFSDPERQVNTFHFLAELEHKNPEMVKELLSSDGFHQYRAVNYLRTLPNSGLREVFDKITGADIKFGENQFDWRASYSDADSVSEAQESALQTIVTGTGFFGGNEGLDAVFDLDSDRINLAGIRSEALTSFEMAATFYQRLGIPDATNKAARDVAVGLGQRYAALPGQDGSVSFVRADRLPKDRVHLGTSVPNPNKFGPDGQPVMENTIDTFYGDVEALGEIFPARKYDPDQVGLVYDRDAAAVGGFALYADGKPVMIDISAPIDVDMIRSGPGPRGPATLDEAGGATAGGADPASSPALQPVTKQTRVLSEAEFNATLPPGWAMKEHDPRLGSSWRTLVYVPRLAGEDPTVAERAARFKAPHRINKLGMDQTGP